MSIVATNINHSLHIIGRINLKANTLDLTRESCEIYDRNSTFAGQCERIKEEMGLKILFNGVLIHKQIPINFNN